MSDPLRSYQMRVWEDTRAAYKLGKRAICIVMPTGSGKTRLGAEYVRNHIRRPGCCVLWLAHRKELIEQAAWRLREEGLDVGVIAAGLEENPERPVQVASIQTLVARGRLPEATLVVFDECHHYVADDWGKIAAHYSSAIRLGLTATPERSDGKPLGDLFDGLVVGPSTHELTELGYLVPCDVHAPAQRLGNDELCQKPVEMYLKLSPGKRAFVFTLRKHTALKLAEAFVEAGVSAGCVTQDTPKAERAQLVEAFRKGELLVLCNVQVFTEGTDVPEAEVCILARGAAHASTYLQMIGRVLRPAPGKERAMVMDLRGVSRSFGLPSDERVYSLHGKAIRVVPKKGAKLKSEPGARPPSDPTIVELPTELVAQIAKLADKWAPRMRGHMRVDLERWIRWSLKLGYKEGWVVHRFRERYGVPPWRWRQAGRMERVG